MKKIWILNHYATTEYKNRGGRPYSLAKYMHQAGYDVIVFCASTLHSTGDQLVRIEEGLYCEQTPESGVRHVFVQCRLYKGNGKARIMNMIDFYRNGMKVVSSFAEREGAPDVIIGSSVHPLACAAAIKLAKKYRIESVAEIRDLWPETLISYGIASAGNPAVVLLRRLEKWIYRKANALVFTMEGAYDYIVERGWTEDVPKEKVHFVNNGVDLEEFDYNRVNCTVNDEDLRNKNVFKVVYAGSVRKVNDVGKLVSIAKLVKNPDIRFLIWGDGDELPALKERIEKEQIGNVVLKGRIDKKYIPYITSNADLNIAHNNASPIFRFGISFNKLFEYFAAGRPILCDFSCDYNPAIDCGAGISVDSGDVADAADAIDRLSKAGEEELEKLAHHARQAAARYDYRLLAQTYTGIMEDTIKMH